MALPVGVQTKTLSIGREFDGNGLTATLHIVVTPDFGGAQRILWTATGETFAAKPFTPVTQTEPDGDPVETFDLPIVDEAGWVDMATGNAITDWQYAVTVAVTFAETVNGVAVKTKMKPYTKFVSPVAASSSPIDMDKLPYGTPSTPTLAPVPVSTLADLDSAVQARSKRTFGVAAATGTDWANLNTALQAAKAAGGGTVTCQPGQTYVVAAELPLPTKVVLDLNGSTLKLANGTNTRVVATEGFDALTGTNKWLVSAGVPVGFGIVNGYIDGNKANNPSGGHGVAIYGKRYTVDNLIVHDCHGDGFYSEAADTGGQTQTDDLPEGRIDRLYARSNGGRGVSYNGPHDMHIGSIFAALNGTEGVAFGRSVGAYSGEADVALIHSYANVGIGVLVGANCRIRAGEVIGESNSAEGVSLVGLNSQIGILQAYSNCTATGTYQVVVGGNGNVVTNAKVEKCRAAIGGLQVTGSSNDITVTADGDGVSGAVGVGVSGTQNRVRGRSTNFTATGGIGLRTGNSSTLTSSDIRVVVDNNDTGWVNASTGSLNTYHVRGVMGAGQTLFSGNGPNGTAGNEVWDLKGTESGTYRCSRLKKVSGGTFNLTSTAYQTLNVGCPEMVKTPLAQGISATLQFTGGGALDVAMPLTLIGITSSNIQFGFQLRTAATGTAAITCQAEL